MGSDLQKTAATRFLKKAVLFLLLLVLLDFTVGSFLKRFYYAQESGLEARTIYAIDKSKEDLIVLGSSRASHHYVPEILTKKTGLSAYNAGREGNFILYHNAVLQCISQRYKPKVVILDVLNKEFSVNPDSYDRLSNLMPFYRSHDAVKPIINLRGPFEPIKNLSFIYPYNSKLQAIAMGNLEANKKRKQDFNGYIPLGRVMSRPAEMVPVDSSYAIDTVKIAAYRALIKTCKNNNIRLLIVCSPYYDRLGGVDPSVRIAREIAAENEVPFFDFTGSEEYAGKPDIFDDKAHLNEKGAALYSAFIADKINDTKNDASAKR